MRVLALALLLALSACGEHIPLPSEKDGLSSSPRPQPRPEGMVSDGINSSGEGFNGKRRL